MLNIEQINQIENQVESAAISFSHLSDDLIDHICCDVETRMDKGETFDQAFKNVKEKIGIEGLKKIEDQTLLIINQNYLIMKKALYVLSIISASLVVLSGIFKILHLPGASILLVFSFMALVLGFLPLLFLTRNKEDKERKQVWVNITGYLASSIFLLSVLWGIMHWPGRIWLLILSWILILGFFLPAYIISTIKAKDIVQRITNIGVILLIVFILVVRIVISFNSSPYYYVQHDTVVNNLHEMTEYYTHQNEYLYNRLIEDTSLTLAEKKSILLLKEKSAAFESELVSLALDIDRINDYRSLRIKDKKPDDFEARVEKIRLLAIDYRASIIKEFSLSEDMRKLFERTCETEGSKEMNIYEIYFTRPAFMIRNTLFRLNRDLLIIENEILEQIRERV